ncbi:hypothetical protein GE061_013938 [Apolygus lucorum]|uniref:Salivary secreted peptide n=1 Tax=Apolygus lucorum TaxID=248454 RepID=A0A8S9XPG0_APOLU|nr:hypothetical protein GE061_013938 [Apolygus lucorum]
MERLCIAMTSGLLVAVLLAITAPNPAVAIECGNTTSHNVIMGHRLTGDELLFMDHPKKDSHWLRTVNMNSNSGQLPKVISYIEVIDGFRNGKGGCAFLTSGGLGSKNVAFHLKSQRSEGIDFTIKVYGRFAV